MQPKKRTISYPLQGHGWSWKPLFSANKPRNRKPNTTSPHLLTYKRELNHENPWTQGGKQHTQETQNRIHGDRLCVTALGKDNQYSF